MSADAEQMADLHLLDPATLTFRREGSRLRLRQGEDEEWTEVSVLRLFPLSEAERWLSVQDAEGKELGILAEARGLHRDSLEAVRDELRRRYLVPHIERITACKDRFDLVEWTVETDRGPITFLMRHVQENIKQPLPRRLTLTDVEGNRYDIPNIDDLDPASKKMLMEHL